MIPCALAGDSIAVGIAPFFKHCVVDAKIGISSAAIIGRVHDADVLVVSAGSNDPRNPHLEANLKIIRAKASGKVIWISPIDRTAAEAVVRVAAIHGDRVVRFSSGRDHVHPRSEGSLAAAVRGAF